MRGTRKDPERTEVRVLLRRLPLAGARVLEIGCGEGRLTRRIAGVARSVVGIDPDAAAIATARRLLPRRFAGRVRFDVGTGQRLPYGGGAFPVVICSWSL